MSIYADILDLAKTKAQIGNLQSQAQLRGAQANAANQLAQTEQQTRVITREFEQQKADRANADAANTGAAGLGSADEFGTNPQMAAIQSDIQRATQDYQYHTQLASALRARGGDLKLAEKFDDNARQARQDIANGQLRMLEERKNVLREVGGLAGSAREDNFGTVRDRLDQLMPGWDRGKDVDFSPLEGGKVVYGPRTAAVLRTLSDSSMTAHEQAEAQHQTAVELNTSQRDATLAEEYASRAWKREQDVRLKREGMAKKADPTANVKVPAPKAVTSSEANANTPMLRDELGVDIGSAKVAAWDYLRERNRLLASGAKPEEADDQALAFVKKRVQPGTDTVPAPWYKPWQADEPAKPGKYSKSAAAPASLAPMDALGKSLADSGLEGFEITKDGTVQARGGGPVQVKTPAQARKLPSGTVFTDPTGVKRRVP